MVSGPGDSTLSHRDLTPLTQKEELDMTRMLRIHSESGYMHVMVRGNGRQILFEDKTDYLYFLNLLRRFSKETAVTICAYCLM